MYDACRRAAESVYKISESIRDLQVLYFTENSVCYYPSRSQKIKSKRLQKQLS